MTEVTVLRCNRCGRFLRQPAAEVKVGNVTVVYGKACARQRGLLGPIVPRMFSRPRKPRTTPQLALDLA